MSRRDDEPRRLRSVCATCGAVFEHDDGERRADCYGCRPRPAPTPSKLRRGTTKERGYGHKWRKLSERARRLATACSDCGTADDLTTDHSVEAWRRHDAGLPIRLRDVDVVCRRCNAERGAARGARGHEHERWETRTLDELAAELDELDE